MATPRPCNGHRSWNAWNVALWIDNDRTLYHFALECLRSAGGNADRATNLFMRVMGNQRTPDRGVYTHLAVKLALQGLQEERNYGRR